MLQKIIFRFLATVGVLVGLSSCTFPAKPTGFLKDPPKMAKDESTSYQRSWIDQEARLSKYRKVYVAPVALHNARLRNMVLNSRNLTGRQKTDLQLNSQVLQGKFKKAFTRSKKQWEILDQKSGDSDAISLELNVVEVATSRPVVEFVGNFYTGGTLLNRPSMAIEGRIVDLKSGKVLAKFADREKPPISALSISKLQYYKAHKNLMRDWARQTVKWIERTNPKEKVWDILPATLIDY